ncbi:MAG: hypothetical protein IJ201_12095 [Solobacterium sp.]|nr:hypothetical protein [Solobacterium sp.]
MIYIQMFHCFRSLILSGSGRMQKIHSSLKEANRKIHSFICPHVILMDAATQTA